jgi:hypothetical protein
MWNLPSVSSETSCSQKSQAVDSIGSIPANGRVEKVACKILFPTSVANGLILENYLTQPWNAYAQKSYD